MLGSPRGSLSNRPAIVGRNSRRPGHGRRATTRDWFAFRIRSSHQQVSVAAGQSVVRGEIGRADGAAEVDLVEAVGWRSCRQVLRHRDDVLP